MSSQEIFTRYTRLPRLGFWVFWSSLHKKNSPFFIVLSRNFYTTMMGAEWHVAGLLPLRPIVIFPPIVNLKKKRYLGWTCFKLETGSWSRILKTEKDDSPSSKPSGCDELTVGSSHNNNNPVSSVQLQELHYPNKSTSTISDLACINFQYRCSVLLPDVPKWQVWMSITHVHLGMCLHAMETHPQVQGCHRFLNFLAYRNRDLQRYPSLIEQIKLQKVSVVNV